MRRILLFLILAAQLGWALDRQPNADYRARRQALAGRATGGMVLLFAPNEAEGPNDVYGYRPDNNFFYLSGWAEPGAALLVAETRESENAAAPRYTEVLFLPERDLSQEKWTGPKLGSDDPEAGKITGFDRVEPLGSLRAELVRLLTRESNRESIPIFRPTSRLRTRKPRSTG